MPDQFNFDEISQAAGERLATMSAKHGAGGGTVLSRIKRPHLDDAIVDFVHATNDQICLITYIVTGTWSAIYQHNDRNIEKFVGLSKSLEVLIEQTIKSVKTLHRLPVVETSFADTDYEVVLRQIKANMFEIETMLGDLSDYEQEPEEGKDDEIDLVFRQFSSELVDELLEQNAYNEFIKEGDKGLEFEVAPFEVVAYKLISYGFNHEIRDNTLKRKLKADFQKMLASPVKYKEWLSPAEYKALPGILASIIRETWPDKQAATVTASFGGSIEEAAGAKALTVNGVKKIEEALESLLSAESHATNMEYYTNIGPNKRTLYIPGGKGATREVSREDIETYYNGLSAVGEALSNLNKLSSHTKKLIDYNAYKKILEDMEGLIGYLTNFYGAFGDLDGISEEGWQKLSADFDKFRVRLREVHAKNHLMIYDPFKKMLIYKVIPHITVALVASGAFFVPPRGRIMQQVLKGCKFMDKNTGSGQNLQNLLTTSMWESIQDFLLFLRQRHELFGTWNEQDQKMNSSYDKLSNFTDDELIERINQWSDYIRQDRIGRF